MPEPTIETRGVDFVLVPVQDMARARRFYANVLGMTESSLWRRGDEDPLGAEFENGTVTLALFDVAKVGRSSAAAAARSR